VTRSPSVEVPGSCGAGIGACPISGYCCSKWGFCGTTELYCGSGCQADYGTCGGDFPTMTPVDLPIHTPVELPVPHPVAVPIPAPIEFPVPAPVELPVPHPVAVPIPAPIEIPVPAPVELPVPHPIAVPIPAPIDFPVPAPVVLPPFSTPVAEPTAAGETISPTPGWMRHPIISIARWVWHHVYPPCCKNQPNYDPNYRPRGICLPHRHKCDNPGFFNGIGRKDWSFVAA
jgi:hypothetical protein